ncbi:MAG: glycosyltransferase family 4 protein [Ginsengibacter sp.]
MENSQLQHSIPGDEKILFLKYGSFSNVNGSVLKILESEFPEYEIEELDAQHLIKTQTSTIHFFINILYFIKEYGIQFLNKKKPWRSYKGWFLSTSYITLLLSKKIQKLCYGKNYIFTFQTQSLFNGKLPNIPNFIYTDHTTQTNLLYPDIDPQEYMRSKSWIKRAETKIYKDATMIFTFGSLVRHSLISQYKIPAKKIITTFTGSNVEIPNLHSIKDDSSKNILFVGGDWERKGGPILIEVFEQVLKKHPDASLTVIGNSPKNLSLPNCAFIGKIPLEQLGDYYDSASIFCMPTLREPFGVSFVEAMKHKLPIISNNIGGLPDLVINDYNGYLINNDVEEYIKAICHLLDNPEKRKQMGENGYNFALKNFTWQKVGETLKSNIKNALEKKKSAQMPI